ncbi:MAG: PspA/IM30 family protein [Pseudomonadota bacterium]
MNLWSTLGTLLRGQARQSLEAVVDANALGILEQELHEADSALLVSRQQLTLLCAQRIGLERERALQGQRHQEREAQARAALALNDEALALEVAAQLARLESRMSEQDRQIERLTTQEIKLKARLHSSAQSIQDHRRELVQVRATASAQRASALSGGHLLQVNGRVSAMQASLARIKVRQQAFEDQEQAAQALQDEDGASALNHRLQRAGIVAVHDADAVLRRLKQTTA